MRTLRLYATLRDIVGGPNITVPFEDGGTVRDLICAVEKVHPRLGAEIVGPDGKFTGLVHVYVEGRNVEWLQGMDTVIRPGDELFLIPPVAGG